MVWYSTRASIANREISVLAIAETAVAILLTIWIYRHFGIVGHIAASVAIAPFLLTRTPRSTELNVGFAFNTARAIWNWLAPIRPNNDPPEFFSSLRLVLWLLLVNISAILAVFATKLIVFFWSLVTHPIDAFGHIPDNWKKLVLCTDSWTLPEIIPGASDLLDENRRRALSQFDIRLWIDVFGIRNFDLKATKILGSIVLVVVLFPIFIPAVAYRWSIKATAIIWSPLAWAFRPIRNDEDAVVFVKEILELSLFKFARVYSALVIALFCFKIFVFIFWLRLQATFSEAAGWLIIEAYLAPDTIPLWHITALINAVLTGIIFLTAERFLYKVKNGMTVSSDRMKGFLKTVFVTRNVLAIYTAICTSYVTIKLASRIEFPTLNVILFPW